MIILYVVNIQANTIMMQKNKLCKKYSRCKAALSSSADEDSYGAVFADF
jgi:hypothetical protein